MKNYSYRSEIIYVRMCDLNRLRKIIKERRKFVKVCMFFKVCVSLSRLLLIRVRNVRVESRRVYLIMNHNFS